MSEYTTTNPSVKPMYRVTQFIWFIFSVVEAILLIRFILKLVGANASAGFTKFIYSISYPLMKPFLYIVRSPEVVGGTIEWSTLIALIIYSLIAWFLVRFIVMSRPITSTEARYGLEREEA